MSYRGLPAYRRPSADAPPWGRFQPACPRRLRPRPRLPASVLRDGDWSMLWQSTLGVLRRAQYRPSSLLAYRQVLRAFRAHLNAHLAPELHDRPGQASATLARSFLHGVVAENASWSWTALHISVLRTVFDKLGGGSLTTGLRTPKRPRPLRDIVAPSEAQRLLAAARTARDRLVLGLLVDCGLKVGELCALRLEHIDLPAATLHIRFAGGTRQRTVPVPARLLPLLSAELAFREPAGYLFPSRDPSRPLTPRTIQRIVRRAVQAADLRKDITPMNLRHSYGVTRLRDGANIRELQEQMGHRQVKTTLNYQRYIVPPTIVSPADSLRIPFPLAATKPADCGRHPPRGP